MLYFILAAVLVAIDQIVKAFVRANIPLGTSIPFLPGVMDLAYVQNTGAAFSLFEGRTWILSIISLVISVILAAALALKLFKRPFPRLALALVLAGAVGNLIDRMLLGFVTDMFQTTFINFAVFNVADICVVLGGIAVCVYVIFFSEKCANKGKYADDSHHTDR